MVTSLADLRRLPQRRKIIYVLAATTITILIGALLLSTTYSQLSAPLTVIFRPKHTVPERASPPYQFVAASLKGDDTAWLTEHFPEWKANVYVANDQNATLAVPLNKGREGMTYLTFIIDNYAHLPEITIFLHGLRYQWHNDNPAYDGLWMLQHLQIPHLLSEGYVNLRCVWTLGCPAELHPFDASTRAAGDSARLTEEAYAAAFTELFPGEASAHIIGVPCCAQFSVTREKILERPLTDYLRYREWLTNTTLPDDISGRVLEYSWHQIFGKPAVHCPDPAACYCNLYGLCNMTCTTEKCGNFWPFPPSSSMPKGWPETGWDGKPQEIPSIVPS